MQAHNTPVKRRSTDNRVVSGTTSRPTQPDTARHHNDYNNTIRSICIQQNSQLTSQHTNLQTLLWHEPLQSQAADVGARRHQDRATSQLFHSHQAAGRANTMLVWLVRQQCKFRPSQFWPIVATKQAHVVAQGRVPDRRNFVERLGYLVLQIGNKACSVVKASRQLC